MSPACQTGPNRYEEPIVAINKFQPTGSRNTGRCGHGCAAKFVCRMLGIKQVCDLCLKPDEERRRMVHDERTGSTSRLRVYIGNDSTWSRCLPGPAGPFRQKKANALSGEAIPQPCDGNSTSPTWLTRGPRRVGLQTPNNR